MVNKPASQVAPKTCRKTPVPILARCSCNAQPQTGTFPPFKPELLGTLWLTAGCLCDSMFPELHPSTSVGGKTVHLSVAPLLCRKQILDDARRRACGVCPKPPVPYIMRRYPFSVLPSHTTAPVLVSMDTTLIALRGFASLQPPPPPAPPSHRRYHGIIAVAIFCAGDQDQHDGADRPHAGPGTRSAALVVADQGHRHGTPCAALG